MEPTGTTQRKLIKPTDLPTQNFLCRSMLMSPCGKVKDMDWPNGPTNLEELFRWPQYNSETLLGHPELGATCAANVLELMKHDIYINDCYSGTGTGSYTMHLQHTYLKSD